MILFRKASNGISGILFSPFEGWGEVWLLVWASLLTAVLVLVVYRFFTCPESIQAAKDRLKAHILEIRLFRDDPVLTARAFRAVLASNLRYLSLNVKPFLILVVPVLLILIQLEARLGHRPLLPGESTLVHTFWNATPGTRGLPTPPSLLASGNITVETPPLRIPDKREVDWKIVAGPKGDGGLTIRYGEHSVTLPVYVSSRVTSISTRSVAEDSLEGILHPMAQPLPPDGDLEAVEICYPHRNLCVVGCAVHWIWAYLGLSLGAGYLLKGAFGVTF